MKDFSLTKEELEERLVALDATRDDFKPVGRFAMCYSPALLSSVDVTETCESCGMPFNVLGVQDYGYKTAIDSYEELTSKYRALGYDARILFYCDECAREKSLPEARGNATNAFFAFRAKRANEYRLTPLDARRFNGHELWVAFKFLKGVKSYQELDESLSGGSDLKTAEDYLECIERILGLVG